MGSGERQTKVRPERANDGRSPAIGPGLPRGIADVIASDRRSIPALLAAFVLSWNAPGPAGADEAEARRLLDEVREAYRAMPAYADEGSFALALDLGGRPLERSRPIRLAFTRPNRIALTAPQVRLIGDGTSLTTVVEPLRTFTVGPCPAEIVPETFDNMSIGAFLFGDPSGTPTTLILGLLAGQDPAARLLGPTGHLVLEEDRPVDGRPARVLRFDRRDGPDVRWLIEPETRHVVRVEILADLDESETHSDPVGFRPSGLSAAWTSGPISTEVPPEGTFTFTPPAGFARVADLASRRAPAEVQRTPLEDLVDKPAPAFALTVLDGPGRTRSLTLADDLKGKIVLLDFWATWCGPCLAELPEIQGLIDDYARRAPEGVVVVALSQDAEPAELEGVRRKVEATLTEKDLSLASGPVGRVAIDPQQAIGDAFHVTGYPTLVLIDGEGVVRAVQVGYRPGVRDRLADQIDAIREGRPLKPSSQPAVGP